MTDRPSASGKLLDAETWDALKASGYTEQELLADQPTGPIIFSYSRRQAIEDGVLVDVTAIARGEGFKIPVALTCGLYGQLTTIVKDGQPAQMPEGLRRTMVVGLLRFLRRQIARDVAAGRNSDRCDFTLGGTAMYALVGPGDDAEPVMTVMLIGED